MVQHTFLLSRQRDAIASFLFSACAVQMDFCEIKFLVDICENIENFYFSVVSMDICQFIANYVFTWPETRSMWPCYGKFLFVPDVGKGKYPWVKKPSTDCKFCLIFTPEQRFQLATPTYKIKKEKREAKKLESELSSTPGKNNMRSPNPSLVDPAYVSVIGAVSWFW